MTHIVSARNVNDAFSNGLRWLLVAGQREDSRNGTVLVAPGPVLSVYNRPTERVLFLPTRDANPFFHLFESIWMLAGRNDLAFPKMFNSRFGEYSDDGVVIHGAYGHRWRNHFGRDQLDDIVAELITEPHSRRAVLQIWDARADLDKLRSGGRDAPCNTVAYFDCRGGRLNMTVSNRSNDAIWGAYGANAVHFSILLEYLAARIGVPVGVYRQFSNNLHAYTDVYPEQKLGEMAEASEEWDLYATRGLSPYPMVKDADHFVSDCERFIDAPFDSEYVNPFFDEVAVPMLCAWKSRKDGDPRAIVDGCLASVKADDWRVACEAWVARRREVKA